MSNSGDYTRPAGPHPVDQVLNVDSGLPIVSLTPRDGYFPADYVISNPSIGSTDPDVTGTFYLLGSLTLWDISLDLGPVLFPGLDRAAQVIPGPHGIGYHSDSVTGDIEMVDPVIQFETWLVSDYGDDITSVYFRFK